MGRKYERKGLDDIVSGRSTQDILERFAEAAPADHILERKFRRVRGSDIVDPSPFQRCLSAAQVCGKFGK